MATKYQVSVTNTVETVYETTAESAMEAEVNCLGASKEAVVRKVFESRNVHVMEVLDATA